MYREFYDKLKAIVAVEQIAENEPMSKHTTFRIGGNADMFVSPTLSQLPEILSLANAFDVPVTIIGNGSNLLVGDKGIRGLVISIGKKLVRLEVRIRFFLYFTMVHSSRSWSFPRKSRRFLSALPFNPSSLTRSRCMRWRNWRSVLRRMG